MSFNIKNIHTVLKKASSQIATEDQLGISKYPIDSGFTITEGSVGLNLDKSSLCIVNNKLAVMHGDEGIGDPMIAQQDILGISMFPNSSGLIIDAEGKVSVDHGNGLFIDGQGKLSVVTENGLGVNNNGVSVIVGDGLNVDNNGISVNVGDGLNISNGSVSVNVGYGLNISKSSM